MGGFSGIWQWLVVLAVVLLLFGTGGRISRVMGDLGKGIGAFRRGLGDKQSDSQQDQPTEAQPQELRHDAQSDVQQDTAPNQAHTTQTTQNSTTAG